MPNLDGTGPMGRGSGARGLGPRARVANRPAGSSKCICPNCNHEIPHQRGVACSQVKCPKCQTPMKGVNCI